MTSQPQVLSTEDEAAERWILPPVCRPSTTLLDAARPPHDQSQTRQLVLLEATLAAAADDAVDVQDITRMAPERAIAASAARTPRAGCFRLLGGL